MNFVKSATAKPGKPNRRRMRTWPRGNSSAKVVNSGEPLAALSKKPELLAPGGSLEKCKIAFLYGADAVYVGGPEFSLRSYARNLSDHDLAEAVFVAHRLHKRLYVTINIYARAADLKTLPPYLEYLQQLGVDAVIVSDPGVLVSVRRHASDLAVHLSTQANTTRPSSQRVKPDQVLSNLEGMGDTLNE